MLFIKTKIIVPETHRALLFKDAQFCDVLMPGVHTMWDWKGQFSYTLVDISETLEDGVYDDALKVLKLHWKI